MGIMRKPKEHRLEDGSVRWRVRYRLGGKETSETFRRKTDADTFSAILDGGSVTAALEWLRARETKASELTFGQWFAVYVDQLTGVTERTRNDYRSLQRRYFAHLADIPLTLITRSDVTAIVNRLDRDGRAPKTIRSAIHTLSTCLQLAVDERHLQVNPCRGVRLPSQSLDVVEPRFLTFEEAGALVASMPERYQPLVTFLFGTGLRWSEATAQFARHVNLEAGTARVDQAWKRVPGKGLVLGPPKTLRARRTVNAAVDALLAAEPLLRKPGDLVFITKSGGKITHANFFNNVWQPAVERADLGGWDQIGGQKVWRGPRIHDTRHTHASWLISDGIQLEAVQDQLGHESILTTRKIYGHLLPALGVAVGKSASAAMHRALAAAPRALPSVNGVQIP